MMNWFRSGVKVSVDAARGNFFEFTWALISKTGPKDIHILDFYIYYKKWMQRSDPQIGTTRRERLVRIIEGILNDEGFEEAAVNVPNRGFIEVLPEFMVVEVPARIDAQGVHGIALPAMPKGFAGLLANQVAVHDLTAEAVLQKSKKLALQALLVDPVVDQVDAAEELLDHMIALQPQYLAYLE